MLVKLLFYNFFSLTNFSILEFNAISAYLVINHWVAIGFSIFLKLGKYEIWMFFRSHNFSIQWDLAYLNLRKAQKNQKKKLCLMHPLIWTSLRESLQNSNDTSYVVESSFFYISSYLHYNTLKLESAEAQKRGEKKSWKIKTVKLFCWRKEK